MTHFLITFTRYAQSQKIGKPNNCEQQQQYKQDGHNMLWSSIPERG